MLVRKTVNKCQENETTELKKMNKSFSLCRSIKIVLSYEQNCISTGFRFNRSHSKMKKCALKCNEKHLIQNKGALNCDTENAWKREKTLHKPIFFLFTSIIINMQILKMKVLNAIK